MLVITDTILHLILHFTSPSLLLLPLHYLVNVHTYIYSFLSFLFLSSSFISSLIMSQDSCSLFFFFFFFFFYNIPFFPFFPSLPLQLYNSLFIYLSIYLSIYLYPLHFPLFSCFLCFHSLLFSYFSFLL